MNSSAWNHIVYTSDSNGNTLYINGSEAARTFTSGSSSTQAFFSHAGSFNQMNVFAIIWSSTDYYTSLPSDQVAIWNIALTSTEISALYNSGSGLAYSNW